ncbi:MAG: Benzoylformate decarboxylase [uncultured Rubrobacteraceae bacterium]|uniref:Benzoylformate decarboxylase n=1 Tax=uncultured Rubrobacteraceae bacterium TaxID=349277 RepID=A0A6J4QL22_9ACTN|nr:MAG: Benzoylformate decarboxylase [uncultured Rubrobacteraceae bacterium]
MATVREVTHDLLRDLGMTTVFGNPGSTELPFLQDFPEDFRYVLALQEASALGMADGYAQGTGSAAFVNLHTGPGLGNAMGAMVTAWHNRTPLVVTAGQQDRRHIALEPLLTGDLVDLAKPYVKRSHEPYRAEDVPREIHRAYHTAMQNPRGPVFVSIPMNDWDSDAEPFAAREISHRSAPDPEALGRVAQVLAGAQRPAIVAGPGVARAGAFYDAVALAEKMRAEVWAAPNSPLAGFPEDHPLFRGHLVLAQKGLAEQLSPYDVVLVLGAQVFQYYPYVPGPVVEEGTRLVQVTEDPEEANRAATGTSLIGDVGVAIRQLTGLLPETDRQAPPAPEPPPAPEASSPMSVGYVMHVLSEVLPEDAMVADESASSKAKLHRYIRPSRPGGYLTSAAGGLGYCLPAAVGLKLAQPERPVVCVIGDGSVSYSIQALWSAARYGVGVVVVVVNNRGYSILKGFRNAIGIDDTVPGLDVPGIDFVHLAEGFGASGERVEEAEILGEALTRALAAGRPYLLDVIVDPAVPKLLS